MADRFHRPRYDKVVALVAIVLLAATGCAIAVDDVAITTQSSLTTVDPGTSPNETAGTSSLAATGPSPGTTHWHAAYVVRVCDDVLVPFDSDADPLGIHSHADGLIHIHPFFEESGFERATLGLFADAMGLGLGPGELTMPQGGTWRDGDLCDGQPGRVFVDRWSGPTPDSPVERIFDNFDEIRFEADGELYQIGFAPPDSPPVVPPAWSVLPEVSNLITETPEPWVELAPDATPASVRVWPVAAVAASPCGLDSIPESVDAALEPSCFTPGDPIFDNGEAITAASAALFNRQPAVDVTISPVFRQWLVESFRDQSQQGLDGGIAIAIEVDGRVVTAPVLARLPASDTRMVISGGMSPATAERLAAVLNG